MNKFKQNIGNTKCMSNSGSDFQIKNLDISNELNINNMKGNNFDDKLINISQDSESK